MVTTTNNLTTGHVGLNVSDLDRSAAFYREVLELEVITESDDAARRWAFLGADGRIVVTLWQQSTGRFSPDRPGLHHLSFEVGSLDAVRAAEQRLHALGAEFAYDGVVPHAEGAPSGGIFFTDPDGTRLEIYTADVPADLAAPSGDGPTCGFF